MTDRNVFDKVQSLCFLYTVLVVNAIQFINDREFIDACLNPAYLQTRLLLRNKCSNFRFWEANELSA